MSKNKSEKELKDNNPEVNTYLSDDGNVCEGNPPDGEINNSEELNISNGDDNDAGDSKFLDDENSNVSNIDSLDNSGNNTGLEDIEIIEKLKDIISKRRHKPSRKLCNQAESLLQNEYKATDEDADEKIEKIIKALEAVTHTCSVRFKLKLDLIQTIIEE